MSHLPESRRGLFIDLDGTLVDSLVLFHDVYHRFLAKTKRTGSPDEFALLNGPKVPEMVRILSQRHALPGQDDAYILLYNQLIDEGYETLPCRPGARDVLASATEHGWLVTLVTANSTERASRWLQSQKLDSLIVRIVSGDLVARGKPDPEIYLRALELTGCSAPASMAIEDSPNGARAAVRAGLPTWVCPSEPSSDSDWPAEIKRIATLSDLLPRLRT